MAKKMKTKKEIKAYIQRIKIPSKLKVIMWLGFNTDDWRASKLSKVKQELVTYAFDLLQVRLEALVLTSNAAWHSNNAYKVLQKQFGDYSEESGTGSGTIEIKLVGTNKGKNKI